MMTRQIVVVGASRGIGREMVLQLARNQEHQILALSRNVDRMNESFGHLENVNTGQLDLSSHDVKAQCEALFARFHQIDILINNAGLLINKPFDELTREDFELSYATHVFGVIETVQAALPKLDKSHVLNISSMGGFQGSVKFPGLCAYSTSKAAIVSFTELFAEEYKDTNIAMNCLCLGAAQTEMLNEAFPGYEAPLSATEMADFIVRFALSGQQWMRGKILPVSLSTP